MYRSRRRRQIPGSIQQVSPLARATASAFEHLEHRRLLSASDLDSTFGTGGIVPTDLPPGGIDTAWDSTIDGAGNIFTVGTSDVANFGWLTKHSSAGVLDPGFGTAGMLDLGPAFEDAIGVAMSGTDIVVVGTSLNADMDFVVAKFNSSGTPLWSNSYDNGLNETAAGVVVRPGGEIVVAGTSDAVDFAVLQLDSGGTADAGFGTAGWTIVDFAGGADVASDIALDGTSVIVAGETVGGGQDYALAKLDSAGALDLSFDTDGKASADFGSSERFNEITISGGWVYGVGAAGAQGGLVRFNAATGALDGAFAGTGQAVVPGTDDATGVGVDSLGNIYVTGFTGADISLSRYDSAGNLDAGFNLTGQVTTSVAPYAFPTGLTVQADDKVLVFGTNDDFLLVRYGDTGGGNSPPDVDPVAGPTTGVRQQSLSFIGSFDDPDLGDTHDVAWDFGDGNTIALHPSTDAGALTPAHTYTSTGTFNVTFTVKDSAGNLVISAVHPVTVSAFGLVGGDLVVGGSGGNDRIVVKDFNSGTFKLRIDDVTVAEFLDSQIDEIYLYGGDGNDELIVELDITKNAFIYGGNGDDVIKGGAGFDALFGEAGSDKIKARGANDIAVGGSGEDTVAGGDGRDLLFGGADADKIAGQDSSDILVAGTTSHDADLTALQAILAEWTSGNSNAVAVNNIRNGGGLNGAYVLKANVTVFDDNAKDTLAGGTGQDWFIANVSGAGVLDKLTGLNSADFVDDLDFILGP